MKQTLPRCPLGRGLFMKIKYILTSIIIFALALFVGCTNNKSTENIDNSSGVNATTLLTLKDVTETFSKNGIELIENKTINPQQLLFKGLAPTVFEVKNDKKGLFYIYTFQNYRDSLMGTEEEQLRTMFYNYYQTQLFPFAIYQAKNLAIIYATQDPNNDYIKKVNDIAFYQLNEGQKLVFKGEGQNWEAQIVYKYYQHWYHDKTGILRPNGYSSERQILKYKGPQIASFYPFSYEYERAGRSGSFSTDDPYPLDEDGYLTDVGVRSSNSPLHDINLPYSMTIHWNGKQETIELTVD